MTIFGIPITFTWASGLSKSDPIVPYQFDGARPPKTHWAQYVVVALVFFLVLATLFFVGLDLAGAIPQ